MPLLPVSQSQYQAQPPDEAMQSADGPSIGSFARSPVTFVPDTQTELGGKRANLNPVSRQAVPGRGLMRAHTSTTPPCGITAVWTGDALW